MTVTELEFMAECEHRSACERLVTLRAKDIMTDSYDWCMCGVCPFHNDRLGKNAKLRAENTKLRELVIALQHCRDGRCGGECFMFTPADNNRGVPPVCEAYGVMRELGIEVES